MKVRKQLRVVLPLIVLALLQLNQSGKSSAQVKKPGSKPPITQSGLLDALRIGGLSPKALVQEIRARGVGFELTPQVEAQLRDAGAKPAVIDAVRANYRPFVGTLNINTSVTGASITVAGIGNYADKITGLKVPPGNYKITGHKLGHRGDTRDVEVKFGQTANVELRLLPMTTEEIMAQAKESFGRSDYGASIGLTRTLLARQPGYPKAVSLLASSLFMQGDYDEATTYFTQAIAAGESIAIPVLHRHGGSWSGKTLSPGQLKFQQTSFGFDSLDFPDESFSVSYAKVVETSIKDQMRLNLKVKVRLPKNRKESDVEYNFYSPDGVATGTIITCPQCLGKMRVVLQLLRQFRSTT